MPWIDIVAGSTYGVTGLQGNHRRPNYLVRAVVGLNLLS